MVTEKYKTLIFSVSYSYVLDVQNNENITAAISGAQCARCRACTGAGLCTQHHCPLESQLYKNQSEPLRDLITPVPCHSCALAKHTAHTETFPPGNDTSVRKVLTCHHGVLKKWEKNKQTFLSLSAESRLY